VSDPAAGVKFRPAAALTGSLTPSLPTVLVTVCESLSSGRKSAARQSDVRASRAGKFPGKSCSALDAQVVASRELPAPVGHHAIDAGAVLGGVQGSPLRFDRARARPSGLDSASAQLRNRQLRDGRRGVPLRRAAMRISGPVRTHGFRKSAAPISPIRHGNQAGPVGARRGSRETNAPPPRRR
jgi:hypothetical protein